MSKYKVLTDSSVWINYFKKGEPAILDRLIEEDLVYINEIIFTELAPILKKQNQLNVIESLGAFERIPLNIDWPIIRGYQYLNLKNGLNHVGIPDLIILQQVIDQKLTLFSFDKHFKLMQNHLKFELFDES
ncbi:PIN domain-containing protein [Rhodohalobacter sp.]|uniref:PIN domain-containing protein n=1 Tax=Rhodohalobacter sp. TaxID=1974210 RepID=UPI002ACD6E81|nr:PIN domain-containing protein [Rhodohalobacter sp.]MDZ7755840.1 PIN domain-containing protein [Rhodohalobacter sp.]